jgi:hypothetical protein
LVFGKKKKKQKDEKKKKMLLRMVEKKKLGLILWILGGGCECPRGGGDSTAGGDGRTISINMYCGW